MHKDIIKTTLTGIAIGLTVAALFTLVIVYVPDLADKALAEPELVTETVLVKSQYVEVYEVTGTHRCGPTAFKKAAIHAFAGQTTKLKDYLEKGFQEAVISDYTRIYNGDVKNRCELQDIKIKFIAENPDEERIEAERLKREAWEAEHNLEIKHETSN